MAATIAPWRRIPSIATTGRTGQTAAVSSLVVNSNMSGYTDPGTSQRGNVTTVARLLNTDGSYSKTSSSYDNAGNVVSTTDGVGNATGYTFTDNFSTSSTLNSQTVATWPSGLLPELCFFCLGYKGDECLEPVHDERL
jgi:hypothetical protein